MAATGHCRAWRLLEFDSGIFGFPVASVDGAVDLPGLSHVLAECSVAGALLAYWTPTAEPADCAPESLPWFNGYPASQNVTLRIELDQWRGLQQPATAAAPPAAVVAASAAVGGATGSTFPVASVPRGPATQALLDLGYEAGWLSRFARDPVLCRAQYERLYGAWVHNSTQRLAADEVLAAYDATGTPVAFCTGKLPPPGSSTASIPLVAVSPACRRSGLGTLVVTAILQWAAASGATSVTIGTQADNAAALALYTRVGFRPISTTTTYHIWLAPAGDDSSAGGTGPGADRPHALRVPHSVPFLTGGELRHVSAALESGAVESGGPYTEACTAWVESTLGAHLALLTTSCTAALELAALLCQLGPGTEAILPSFTYVSTANLVALRGATPVFVDVQPDSLNICPAAVAAAITPRTRAIFVVHYGGAGADMDAIMALAEAHGLLVVEDAAHAFLATYQGSPSSGGGSGGSGGSGLRGRCLGTIGHLGCFSFHHTKNLTCGEGGLLVVNEPRLAAQAQVHYEKGTNRAEFVSQQLAKYEWQDLGGSFVPSEVTAAFLYGQLKHAEELNARRRRICAVYHILLEPLQAAGLLQLMPRDTTGAGSGHIFWLLARSQGERDALRRALAQRGVQAPAHYPPLHLSPGGQRLGRVAGGMQATLAAGSRLLRLPLWPHMTCSHVHHVVAAIYEHCAGRAAATSAPSRAPSLRQVVHLFRTTPVVLPPGSAAEPALQAAWQQAELEPASARGQERALQPQQPDRQLVSRADRDIDSGPPLAQLLSRL